mmetsp:Transcript_19662/g.42705  ORF Transcript_19662/g.42705 Transcript_19662/m.42705 type:complete len:489 (-) Transcript_19662:794-2260(-)
MVEAEAAVAAPASTPVTVVLAPSFLAVASFLVSDMSLTMLTTRSWTLEFALPSESWMSFITAAWEPCVQATASFSTSFTASRSSSRTSPLLTLEPLPSPAMLLVLVAPVVLELPAVVLPVPAPVLLPALIPDAARVLCELPLEVLLVVVLLVPELVVVLVCPWPEPPDAALPVAPAPVAALLPELPLLPVLPVLLEIPTPALAVLLLVPVATDVLLAPAAVATTVVPPLAVALVSACRSWITFFSTSTRSFTIADLETAVSVPFAPPPAEPVPCCVLPAVAAKPLLPLLVLLVVVVVLLPALPSCCCVLPEPAADFRSWITLSFPLLLLLAALAPLVLGEGKSVLADALPSTPADASGASLLLPFCCCCCDCLAPLAACPAARSVPGPEPTPEPAAPVVSDLAASADVDDVLPVAAALSPLSPLSWGPSITLSTLTFLVRACVRSLATLVSILSSSSVSSLALFCRASWVMRIARAEVAVALRAISIA